MKVNEILAEAWSDYLPKFVPSQEIEAEKKRKKQQDYVYKQSARFGDVAYKELDKLLKQQSVRINDPRTYGNMQGTSLQDFLKAFALNFFGSDYTTGNLVKNDINKMPVPAQLSPGSIQQYLNNANNVYRDVLKDQLSVQLRQSSEQQQSQQSQQAIYQLAHAVYTKQTDPSKIPATIADQVGEILKNPPQEWKDELATQEPAEPAQPAGPTLAPGVQVVSADPVILRYGKRDYYIADDGMWHEMNNRNPVADAWQKFFDTQAELVEPQRQVLPKPTAAPKPQPVARPQPQVPAQTRQQPAAPTPEQIRQRKQAAALKKIQSELKPRVKVRPGETLDQAMARASK